MASVAENSEIAAITKRPPKPESGSSARRRFCQGEDGAVLIEFALVVPIMVILFIGLVEFSEAFTVSRKLATTVSTISDLVAQEATISCGELDDVMKIGD